MQQNPDPKNKVKAPNVRTKAVNSNVDLTAPINFNQDPSQINPNANIGAWNAYSKYLQNQKIDGAAFKNNPALNTPEGRAKYTNESIEGFNNSDYVKKYPNNKIDVQQIKYAQDFHKASDPTVFSDGWVGSQTSRLTYPVPDTKYMAAHPASTNPNIPSDMTPKDTTGYIPYVWGNKSYVYKAKDLYDSPTHSIKSARDLIPYDPAIHGSSLQREAIKNDPNYMARFPLTNAVTPVVTPTQNKAKGGSVKAPKVDSFRDGGQAGDGRNNTPDALEAQQGVVGIGNPQFQSTGNATNNQGEMSSQVGDSAKGKGISAGTWSGIAKAATGLGAGIAASSNLKGADKEAAVENTLNNTFDTTVGAIPVWGQAYGAVKGVSDAARASLSKDKNGKALSKESLVMDSGMKTTHEKIFEDISKGNAGDAVLDTLTGGTYGNVRDYLKYDDLQKNRDKVKADAIKDLAAKNGESRMAQEMANRNLGANYVAQKDIYDINSAKFDNTGALESVQAKADGGKIVGPGTGTSDSIKRASIKPGSFIVPKKNAEVAEEIREKVLGKPHNAKEEASEANLKQGGGVPVNLSNGEHLFTPEETNIIESKGIDLDKLAPDAKSHQMVPKLVNMTMMGDKVERKGKAENRTDGGLTSNKAKIMLHDGTINGKPITEQQRKYFGWVAGGRQEKEDGGKIEGYADGGRVPNTKKTYKELITPPLNFSDKEGWKKAVDKQIKEGKVTPIDYKEPKAIKAPKTVNTSNVDAARADQGSLTMKNTPSLESGSSLVNKDVAPSSLVIKDVHANDLPTDNASSSKKKNSGLSDYLNNIDPTMFAGLSQVQQGKDMVRGAVRPIDVNKLDSRYDANVNRAQNEAQYGFTPENKALLEQENQNAINDSRFSARNFAGGNASTAFNQERQAINSGWMNGLSLRSADQDLRMRKAQYADQQVAERAQILDSQRRRAFRDAMNTFQQKQQAGSELIGAGIRNQIGAYRYQQQLNAMNSGQNWTGIPTSDNS